MANANSWELEITSSIPASKVFNEFVLGFFDFVAKNILPADFGMKFTTLEGDGGVGSIKLMSYADDQFPSVKYKVKALDLENLSYSLAMLKETNEGEGEGERERESTVSEMKVIPSSTDTEGGCTFKQINTYYEAISEDDIEDEKGQLTYYFKVYESTVAKDSEDYLPNDY